MSATTHIVSAHDLDAVGAPSARWDGADPPTLERVLLHVFQEYARHAGHLDVAVELAGGATRGVSPPLIRQRTAPKPVAPGAKLNR